jgi:hypothetical protein
MQQVVGIPFSFAVPFPVSRLLHATLGSSCFLQLWDAAKLTQIPFPVEEKECYCCGLTYISSVRQSLLPRFPFRLHVLLITNVHYPVLQGAGERFSPRPFFPVLVCFDYWPLVGIHLHRCQGAGAA